MVTNINWEFTSFGNGFGWYSNVMEDYQYTLPKKDKLPVFTEYLCGLSDTARLFKLTALVNKLTHIQSTRTVIIGWFSSYNEVSPDAKLSLAKLQLQELKDGFFPFKSTYRNFHKEYRFLYEQDLSNYCSTRDGRSWTSIQRPISYQPSSDTPYWQEKNKCSDSCYTTRIT